MADLKISALPASSTPLAGTEILPIVQSATTRQVSVANLTAGRAVSALSLTSTNDATINGITVGRGGGSVSLNTAVGASALAATSTGDGNAAFGGSALASNLAGTGNTATGFASLRDNTSGNYNVASGYLALATNLSGANNVGIGYSVLSTGTATSSNTAIGYEALKVTSGSTNTAIGYQSGVAMTTGTKNVILGSYSGNTGTLDIRTTNNNIVLSDGDGNVRAWWDNANARFYGTLLATGITNSALTSGRVTYAGTAGLLQDSANLTFDGSALAVNGTISSTGDVTVGSSGGTRTLTIGNTASTGAGFINIVTSSSFKNWQIASNQYVASALSFTPSTATGGTTFTTPTLNILDIGISTGNIGVGGTTPTSSGAGITFPATLSASSNANTLDDYEEGTWTPSLGGTTTYTVQSGNYTKIGRLVNIRCNIEVNLIGTGSAFEISGLPFATFTTATGNPAASGSVGYFGSLAINVTYISVITSSGGTTMKTSGLALLGNTASASLAVFGDSARIDFTLTYFTD
jgi:hypothetical protein